MESWRKVWREGFSNQMSTFGLEALRRALLEDDPRVIQGATTMPPPLQSMQDWPVEGCCVLSFGSWQGETLETVAEVEEGFARLCFEADQALGEPGACRYFLNWYDEVPRDEMRRELAAEIDLTLSERVRTEPAAA